jgi:hypothetical protein
LAQDESENLTRIAAGPECTYFLQGVIPRIREDTSKEWWFEFELENAFSSFKYSSFPAKDKRDPRKARPAYASAKSATYEADVE